MKYLKIILVLLIVVSASSAFAQEKAEKEPKKERAEKPFIVHDRTNKVTRVDVRKDLKKTENIIQFDVANATGGASSTRQTFAAAEITGVNVMSGTYNQTREVSRNSRGMSLQLLDVVFPCRVRVNIGDQVADVEIKEQGFWKVGVTLVN